MQNLKPEYVAESDEVSIIKEEGDASHTPKRSARITKVIPLYRFSYLAIPNGIIESKWLMLKAANKKMKSLIKSDAWLDVGFKANCPFIRPGPIGGMPFVGVFSKES